MTYHRPYLAGSDDAAGRQALAHIRDVTRLSRREVAYIEALRVYFSDGTMADRMVRYASAMQTLHRDNPDDPETAAFFALSLLGYGWATDEGFARPEKAGSLAQEVYRLNPNHPGAAHYIIHSFDEPSLAPRALIAARQYARNCARCTTRVAHAFAHFPAAWNVGRRCGFQ
jgi:RimJ/RimL family protein N-acetyltransferase